jgi:hypothetical protein
MKSRRRIALPGVGGSIVAGKTRSLEVVGSEACNVRFGSKADISACPRHVRFTPESGHYRSANKYPLCAKSGHSALQQKSYDFVSKGLLSFVGF